MDFKACMEECPLIGILRGITPEEVERVCDILADEGFRLVEIPLNTPNALTCIALAAKHTEGRMLVGAGTVLEPSEVSGVHQAGGRFVISPDTHEEVICETKGLGMISIPGFFTATEAFRAIRAGADYLKLFPAILGPAYVKDLKAVVKKPILAVGGVSAGNLSQLLSVCAGAGIGSALYKPGKSGEDIRTSARDFMSLLEQG